jgi:aspartate racemase
MFCDNTLMAKHVGIVACSAEGAALCYRTLCVEGAGIFGRHNHPEVSMHTHPLAEYMRCIEADDWSGVAELMLSSARKLAAVGADFLICPDNTIHQAMPQVEPRSPRPWLHIARVVAAEAVRCGYQRLGILGTRYLMNSPVYPSSLAPAGIAGRVPTPAEQERMNAIIFDELVNGKFLDPSRAYCSGVIERLKSAGCDAVVLGCTEIPLLIAQADSSLPILDSTRLLARAALHHAVQETAAPARTA